MGFTELRSILNGYSPIIAGISVVIAHSQTVVAQPRAVPSLPLPDLIAPILPCSIGLPLRNAVWVAAFCRCKLGGRA
jgi:hypothetical protein